MPSRLTVVLVSVLLPTSLIAFWLWLVIVPAKVALLCPGDCKCDSGGYQVSCSSKSLTALPLIHLTDVRILWHFYNKLTLLEKNSFVSMTELKVLVISYCELRTIQLLAFNGLTKLTALIIESNKLSEILPGTFENLSSLKHLVLNFNEIKHLNIAVFCGLTKLINLSVCGNNINELLTGTFEGLNSLENLDLSNNKLQRVDSALFSGLVNLITVDLSNNKLQYLHPHTFLGLPNIKQLNLNENRDIKLPTDRNFINSQPLSALDISHCNVSSLSVETFANVSALQRLDLSYNNLKTVDIDILRALPELSELYLYGNPLQCDCQLQEVWRWCEDRNIRTTFLGQVPICDNPIEVKSMWWGVLEKGKCLEGNIEYFGDYNNTRHIETNIEEQDYENWYGNEYDDEFFNQYQLPVYAFAFVFGTTDNVIFLIIIICNKDMRTVPNMYILNLAISDIIYLTVLFSEACANRITDMWLDNDFTCTFVSFCRRMSVGLSAYSVALYSFQRYRVTVSPFQVRVSSQPKWRGIVATFCGVWIVAALFAVPSALSMDLCAESGDVTIITYNQHVVIFELLVSSALPLCVIAFSYIMTARHLVESSRSISEGTQNPQLEARRNTAKIVVGLTVVFMITYVPYHVFWTYFIYSQENFFKLFITNIRHHPNNKLRSTYLISTCFLSINPCLNPVALFCTSSQFRQHLKSYLTCFCKTSSPSTDFELARRD